MTQRPRVLLVDDDALCLRLLAALITDACGAEVDAYQSAARLGPSPRQLL